MTAVTAHFEGLAELVSRRDPANTPLGLQTILLFGAPGTGKTSLAASFPNHLYMDLENSATNHAVDALDIRTWALFSQFVEWAFQGGDLGDKQTLIVDTVTDLWELCKKHVLAELGLKEAADGDWGKGFSAPRNEFKRVMDMLLSMHKAGRLGLVLIAHEELEEIKTPTQTLQLARPRISDKDIKDYVTAKPQMVLRTAIHRANPLNPADIWQDSKFLIQTKAAGDAVIKDRTNRLPMYLGARYEALEAAYNNKENQ